jgi:glycosyltransferase involved in cell wall biosynthesis
MAEAIAGVAGRCESGSTDIGMPTHTDVARSAPALEVALLTGGWDRPYAFGLATALMADGVRLDIVAGDELDDPAFHGTAGVSFLNLRGDQRPDASWPAKISRVLHYYVRLLRYAATARPSVFHILWNNKFDYFDRTLLTLYYKLLGKIVILTAHNVNTRARDGNDSPLNRWTLKFQYQLADHIFVHTEKMKAELEQQFGVRDSVSVIPFGINNAVPNTAVTCAQARQRLGIRDHERTLLFFGNIAPYKGLEYLVGAFQSLVASGGEYRLIIAGRPKGHDAYWETIHETITREIDPGRVTLKIEYVPDGDAELYFKASDALVLPYVEIFQSGVLFLAYSFGLPVLAADVGSMKDDIVESRTGFVFSKQDVTDLARTIALYFESDLYRCLPERRKDIRDYAHQRHSWQTVSDMTTQVYQESLAQRVRDRIRTTVEQK